MGPVIAIMPDRYGIEKAVMQCTVTDRPTDRVGLGSGMEFGLVSQITCCGTGPAYFLPSSLPGCNLGANAKEIIYRPTPWCRYLIAL